MKIFKLLFIAILTVGLTACSSDDDNNTVELTAENLAGTYEITFYQGEDVTTNDDTGVVVERSNFTTDTFTDATFVFTTNNTYSASGSYRITEVTTVTGESPETDTTIENFEASNVAYSVNTASRTITLDGEIYDVTLFNGTELRLEFTDQETFNGNTSVFTDEIRMRRQN